MKFANYWFSSGNPSFLIKLLIKNQYYLPDLQNTTVDPVFFDSFDIDQINLKILLLQSGYLTISTKLVVGILPLSPVIGLCIPNYEISMSLNAYILQYIYNGDSTPAKVNLQFMEDILADNIDAFKVMITSLFAGIPYNWYTNNNIAHYEGFYCSLLYAFLVGSGYNVIAEDATQLGRIDLTLILQNRVYIFELKTIKNIKKSKQTNTLNVPNNKSTTTDKNIVALAQIKNKKYAEKYQNGNYDKIYLIGLEFSETERNLVDFDYEIME